MTVTFLTPNHLPNILRSKYTVITRRSIRMSVLLALLGGAIWMTGLTRDLSPLDTIYFILIVFPLGITLGHAEGRRFRIMEIMHLILAQVMSLAYAYKDWIHTESTDRTPYKTALIEFIQSLEAYLGESNHGNHDGHFASILAIEVTLGKISHVNELARIAGVPGNEVSRMSQYVNKIYDNLEMLRAYKTNLASSLLSKFLKVTLLWGCVILIPHFLQNGLAGVAVAPLIFFVFSTLLNVERILDNPLIRREITDTIDVHISERTARRIERILG